MFYCFIIVPSECESNVLNYFPLNTMPELASTPVLAFIHFFVIFLLDLEVRPWCGDIEYDKPGYFEPSRFVNVPRQ
jgi:hypothetical protein